MTDRQKKNLKSYCSEPLELVENYKQAEADDFEGWCIHHRLEIQQDGTRVSAQELKDNGLYYDRPSNELVFMRKLEHHRLHWIGNTFNIGKQLSAETRQKMSEAHKGKRHSAEARKKIAEAFKGKHQTQESRQKNSLSHKGRHWWNDGVSCKQSRECPGPEWKRGRIRYK